MQDDYLKEIGHSITEVGIKCSVIGGGSYAYKHNLFQSLGEVRDLDLLIFVLNKEDITDLLTINQKDLIQILQLNQVERYFEREDLEPVYKELVQAVRYSGTNEFGQKISVKIIALNQLNLSLDKPTNINVLSAKDKRYYTNKTITGDCVHIGVINQKLPDGLCILGDPDLIKIKNTYCMGVIADVILSGRILHLHPEININYLKASLILKITKFCEKHGYPKSWSDILVRSDRLEPVFKEEYEQNFPDLGKIKKSDSESPKTKYDIFVVKSIVGGQYPQAKLRKKINSQIKEKRYIKSSGPFSSNSNYGLALYESGEKAFFKEMISQNRFDGEILGLITASAYYPNLRTPIYTDPSRQLVSYDWFPGDILSRQRLREPNSDMENSYLELELKRAEDHLNAYTRSISELKNSNKIYRSQINDLYYGRLCGNRYSEYYSNEKIIVNGKGRSYQELGCLNIVINGSEYKSIEQTTEWAKSVLNPEKLSNSELICGLGDAHSGNIMCSWKMDSYIYVDYEFAGFHSPYLDIAKQLYNDSFFNLFYSDILPESDFRVSIEIKDDRLYIDHDYELDDFSKKIFISKFKGILLPYREFCASCGIKTADNWMEILSASLYCCGLFTRNIAKFREKDALINIAHSIEMTNIINYLVQHIKDAI